MDSRVCWALVALLLLPAAASAGPRSRAAGQGKPAAAAEIPAESEGDPALIAVMHDLNEGLRAEWMDLRAQQIELLSVGQTRPGGRIQPRAFRWVPSDPRRHATGHHLTYLVDDAQAPTGVATVQQVDQALGRASGTWDAVSCIDSLLVRRPHLGGDPDLFDAVFGYGSLGTFPAADVVFAGFLPQPFFDLVAPPAGGQEVIALAVTFIFVDADGVPTDLDGDGYLDAAASEVYFNDGFAWSTDGTAGSIDLETVALHELGHALGIGHVEGSEAVMNSVYAGVRRALQPLDLANACTLWGAREPANLSYD